MQLAVSSWTWHGHSGPIPSDPCHGGGSLSLLEVMAFGILWCVMGRGSRAVLLCSSTQVWSHQLISDVPRLSPEVQDGCSTHNIPRNAEFAFEILQ